MFVCKCAFACVLARVCVSARVCVFVRVYAYACARVSVSVRACPDLEDERRGGLQLQDPRGAEQLEHGVRVVAEALVEHQQAAHVVHHEAQLVRPGPRLREEPVRVGHRRGQAHHEGGAEHRAVLRGHGGAQGSLGVWDGAQGL